jgi:hypothetical protein
MMRAWFRRKLSEVIARASVSDQRTRDERSARSILLLSMPYREHPRGRPPADATERATLLEISIPRSIISFRTSRLKAALLVSPYQPDPTTLPYTLSTTWQTTALRRRYILTFDTNT